MCVWSVCVSFYRVYECKNPLTVRVSRSGNNFLESVLPFRSGLWESDSGCQVVRLVVQALPPTAISLAQSQDCLAGENP